MGIIVKIEKEAGNLHLWLESDFTNELKIDQSIAHNGRWMSVGEKKDKRNKVEARDETVKKTSLRKVSEGDKRSLERCLRVSDRLDGHVEQGHVDQTASLKSIRNENGSYLLDFEYDEDLTGNLTVPKGSICVNGISLTVVDSQKGKFSVYIIPYTWELTYLLQFSIGV